MSPLAKASTKVDGMMFEQEVDRAVDLLARARCRSTSALASSVLGSMFMPWPGPKA